MGGDRTFSPWAFPPPRSSPPPDISPLGHYPPRTGAGWFARNFTHDSFFFLPCPDFPHCFARIWEGSCPPPPCPPASYAYICHYSQRVEDLCYSHKMKDASFLKDARRHLGSSVETRKNDWNIIFWYTCTCVNMAVSEWPWLLLRTLYYRPVWDNLG